MAERVISRLPVVLLSLSVGVCIAGFAASAYLSRTAAKPVPDFDPRVTSIESRPTMGVLSVSGRWDGRRPAVYELSLPDHPDCYPERIDPAFNGDWTWEVYIAAGIEGNEGSIEATTNKACILSTSETLNYSIGKIGDAAPLSPDALKSLGNPPWASKAASKWASSVNAVGWLAAVSTIGLALAVIVGRRRRTSDQPAPAAPHQKSTEVVAALQPAQPQAPSRGVESEAPHAWQPPHQPLPDTSDPLASKYGASWFARKAELVEELKRAQADKAALYRRYAIQATAAAAISIPIALSQIPVVSRLATMLFNLWLVAPVLGIMAVVARRSTKTQKPVIAEIQRARLWEDLAAAGRASRAAGRPSTGGVTAWQSFLGLLITWHGCQNASITFMPDHPFWVDPVSPKWDELWARSIDHPDAFPSGVQKLYAESQQRYNAWFAALPMSDPQTYMAISQLRHQRQMEHEARQQTVAAQVTAAAAQAAAAEARRIAQNTAATAHNTAATAQNTARTADAAARAARELEWQRQFGEQR